MKGPRRSTVPCEFAGKIGGTAFGSRGLAPRNKEALMVDVQHIKEHMEVCGSDGGHVGVVDRLFGAKKIKLTKSDPESGGEHHIIPVDWVEKVDDKVRLKKPAKDAMAQWQTAA